MFSILAKLSVNHYTYNGVEWVFVCKVMKCMAFPVSWRRLVYDSMSTEKFSFYLNRAVKGSVIPSRGLCQGCSLYPYLFLLYAEAFSSSLKDVEERKMLMGFRCTRVSHLFFADDTIVFARAKEDDCRIITMVLAVYEKASGQQITFDKSVITFSPNVMGNEKRTFQSALGIRNSQPIDMYLGLSTVVGVLRRRFLPKSKIGFGKGCRMAT